MKKKNVIKLMLFISAFAPLPIVKIFAGSLGGSPNYFAYEPYHHVFYDRESAIGFVRLNNGFTVTKKASGAGSTHGSMVIMDTVTSVSGAIDLRNTNTLFLNGDLLLENGVTFSSSGNIYSKGQALLLGGNLTIPANTVLHLGGQIIIDGQGNTINLGDNAQLFVDNNSSLTLRNLVISNSKNFVGNPAIKNSSALSQLTLDNVLLDITGDFYFDRGNLFIYNDVVFTGTSAFVYTSCQPSFILSGAKLYFDSDTTFSFAPATHTACPYSTFPTTTNNKFILMQDQTSQICFDGGNFMTTPTGLRLSTGSVLFDNRVNLKSKATSNISSSPFSSPITGVTSASAIAGCSWSPDGRYVFVTSWAGNKFWIFYFNGTTLVDRSSGGVTINQPVFGSWSPDGKFVVIPSLSSNLIYVYSVANGVPSLLSSVSTAYTAPASAKWSPDGRYIAVISQGGGSGGVQIFAFNGSTVVSAVSLATGQNSYSLDWSPDGKFLSVGTFTGPGSTLSVFSFNSPSRLVLVGSVTVGYYLYQVPWSPDGRFIAVPRRTTDNLLDVYSFKGLGGPLQVGTISTGAIDPCSASWSADGRYIVTSGLANVANNIQLYLFNPGVSSATSLTLIGQATLSGGAEFVSFSPNNSFICVGGSTGNIYVYNVNYASSTATQAISNSVVFGDSALGSAYDLDVNLLSGANVVVDGLVNFDNVD